MMKTVKRLAVATFLALAVVSLAGCQTGPDEETTAVIEQIDALGTISSESGPALSKAEAAYRALDDDQKEKVENYETLTNARDEYDSIRAKAVSDAIDSIGEVTLAKADLIDEASDSYSGLTADQKERVTNADTLTAAKTQIDEIRRKFAVGDTVTTSNWKATLTNAYVSSTLQSSESTTCWEPQDGGAFLILEIDLEHLSDSNETVDGTALADIVATYNSHSYSSWEYQYLASELWLYADGYTLDANMPLHLYVYTQIPSSALDDGQPITVDLSVDGEEKTINVR